MEIITILKLSIYSESSYVYWLLSIRRCVLSSLLMFFCWAWLGLCHWTCHTEHAILKIMFLFCLMLDLTWLDAWLLDAFGSKYIGWFAFICDTSQAQQNNVIHIEHAILKIMFLFCLMSRRPKTKYTPWAHRVVFMLRTFGRKCPLSWEQ